MRTCRLAGAYYLAIRIVPSALGQGLGALDVLYLGTIVRIAIDLLLLAVRSEFGRRNVSVI